LKVKIPKNITPRQRELLEEFDKESSLSGGDKAGSGSADAGLSSTIESAWKRVKDFLGKSEEENKKTK
jgi:DnaJ-class molecular chaperone